MNHEAKAERRWNNTRKSTDSLHKHTQTLLYLALLCFIDCIEDDSEAILAPDINQTIDWIDEFNTIHRIVLLSHQPLTLLYSEKFEFHSKINQGVKFREPASHTTANDQLNWIEWRRTNNGHHLPATIFHYAAVTKAKTSTNIDRSVSVAICQLEKRLLYTQFQGKSNTVWGLSTLNTTHQSTQIHTCAWLTLKCCNL